VERWAEDFVHEALLPLLRPQLVQALRAHQAQHDTVALLTGAADFLARPLSRALGVAHCIASLPATRDGRYRARPPRLHPFGAEKLRLARQLCAVCGCGLAQAVAYADSIHDSELLAAVGQPVAVYPDRLLRQRADTSAWVLLGRS
jgi:phosphoserine phosphatase